jgi:hypothetical protein
LVARSTHRVAFKARRIEEDGGRLIARHFHDSFNGVPAVDDRVKVGHKFYRVVDIRVEVEPEDDSR